MDFRKATNLFADEKFDGAPAQIYEPGKGETVVPPDDPSNGVGNVRSEVLLAIWDRLQEAGIEIPCPQRDINISGLSPKMMSALKEEIESPDKQAN